MHLYELDKEEQMEILGIEEGEDEVKFPTQSVCPICSGYVSTSKGMEESIEDKQLAYEVALVQHGYYLAKWNSNVVNRKIIPKPCTCECPKTGERHDLEEVNDDDWSITFKCKDCGKEVSRAYK